ncbi:MAG: acetylornithine/succinylornithine family transaminase [Clostridia bacterium]|nr:acetylornithine/succinylornithine family transaminase [Clostridia bacterium]
MMIKEIDKEYIANTYARFPLTLVEGKGSLVYDEDGKEYIDLGTGIAVNTFGIGDEEWIAAVTAQLGKIQHTSNLYFSEPCANLAKLLCERTGMKKVFFSNSGAEANECAIKAARKYGVDKKGEEYTTVITLKNSFHGRTITTLAATGQDTFHQDFKPLTGGFVYAEPNSMADIEKLCAENKCCAVMFEVVQGEGGVNALDSDYLTALAEFAEKNDILLIADEVQIGNGRSGELYGYMTYGITPDIVSTAKGLAGGLPIGATLLGEKVKDTYTPGLHGSTFGGNPISCAAAINVITRLDGDMLSGVKERSKYIFDELNGAEGIKSVSGLGLMIGVETVRPAAEIISECMERGVLVIKAKNKVRMLPALNIPMDKLKIAIDIFKEVCRK